MEYIFFKIKTVSYYQEVTFSATVPQYVNISSDCFRIDIIIYSAECIIFPNEPMLILSEN